MSPRPVTLAYCTQVPGTPVFSARSDGLVGVEIDIPPQSQRQKRWVPKTFGTVVASLLATVGLIVPPAILLSIWMNRRDAMSGLAVIASLAFVAMVILIAVSVGRELGRRRTIILAGPDGLTITTVGGIAWPKPRHWPRAEILDFALGSIGYDGGCEAVLVKFVGRRTDVVLTELGILPPAEVIEIISCVRSSLGLRDLSQGTSIKPDKAQ